MGVAVGLGVVVIVGVGVNVGGVVDVGVCVAVGELDGVRVNVEVVVAVGSRTANKGLFCASNILAAMIVTITATTAHESVVYKMIA